MNKYKLFVWTEFAPDWSGGLAFAIASDETQAREMVLAKTGYNHSDWGTLEIKSLNEPVAFAVSGGS